MLGMRSKKVEPVKSEEPFEVGPHLTKNVRKLLVRFRGSLNELAEKSDIATWKVTTPEVFAVSPDDEESVKNLEDAILIGAKIKKIQSSFPCDIALDIKDIKQKNYVFGDGKSTHYVTYPKEVNHALDEVLLEPQQSLNSGYLKEHTKYTPKKLFQDVVPIPKSKFSYVGKNNPLIKMINLNSEELQMTLTANDLIDEQYYKVDNDVLYDCADLLINELSSTFPITNLKEFSVSISRADGLEFNDPEGICDNITGDGAISKVMNSKRDLACVLEITYSLPTPDI